MFNQAKPLTAWIYLRHSAEDKQENSVPIQRELISEFAKTHNIQITHEEADEGKSGLTARRPGFERLFDRVLDPNILKPDYILVLNVSRWGRFQELDEGAYWTMLCKQRDIQVVYVEEGFPDESQLLGSSLQTQLKRYLSAEYSRKLSNDVFYGSKKIAEQGYWAGGAASYGLSRVLLNENKKFDRVLKPGEHKAISNQRVTLASSNNQKSAVVRRMFDELNNNWRHPQHIATSLNNDDILTEMGKRWDTSKVVRILSNELYAGTIVYNKTWKRLKSEKRRRNPVSEWVRCEGAFEGIVTPEEFETAQERLYWLMPSRHRYGIYRINAARREFRKYLQEQTKKLTDDDKFKVLQEFPVAFGLTFYQKEQTKRCFLIEEKHRMHDEVLCIGLDMFTKDKIDRAYKLPTNLFGVGDHLIVRDNDTTLQQYLVNVTDTDATIEAICNSLTA